MELKIIMPTKERAKEIEAILKPINKYIRCRPANPKSSIKDKYQVWPRSVNGSFTPLTTDEKKQIVKKLAKIKAVDCWYASLGLNEEWVYFNGSQVDFAIAETIIPKDQITVVLFVDGKGAKQ